MSFDAIRSTLFGSAAAHRCDRGKASAMSSAATASLPTRPLPHRHRTSPEACSCVHVKASDPSARAIIGTWVTIRKARSCSSAWATSAGRPRRRRSSVRRSRRSGSTRRSAPTRPGLGDWHVGQPPDRRAIQAAQKRGYDLSKLRARQVTSADFSRFGWILAMDLANLHALEALRPASYCGTSRPVARSRAAGGPARGAGPVLRRQRRLRAGPGPGRNGERGTAVPRTSGSGAATGRVNAIRATARIARDRGSTHRGRRVLVRRLHHLQRLVRDRNLRRAYPTRPRGRFGLRRRRRLELGLDELEP